MTGMLLADIFEAQEHQKKPLEMLYQDLLCCEVLFFHSLPKF